MVHGTCNRHLILSEKKIGFLVPVWCTELIVRPRRRSPPKKKRPHRRSFSILHDTFGMAVATFWQPGKVRMQRTFQYEKISTTGFRCRLERVETYETLKFTILGLECCHLPSSSAAASSPSNASYKWFLKFFPYF